MSRKGRFALRVGWFLGLVAVLVAADYVYGLVTGIATIRISAKQFRSEAAPYGLNASSLVPRVNHLYTRDDPADKGSRRLRTDDHGTILGSTTIASAKTTVLFLGGSTTECNEVEEPNRFPAVVQDILRNAGLDVRTINAGVRGHTTQDSLISYVGRPGFRSAQIVVLMHNINDRLWLSHLADYSTPPSAPGRTSGAAVFASGKWFLGALWDFVSYRSNVLFVLRRRLTSFNPWTGEPDEGVVSELSVDRGSDRAINRVASFEKNLRAFVWVVRSQGALPVLMTQPLGRISQGQAFFNERVRRVAAEENTHLIDLDSKLTGDRSRVFFGDSIHFNDSGSRIIGGLIAEALGPLLGTTVAAPSLAEEVLAIPKMLARCISPSSNIDRTQVAHPRRILGMPGRYPSFAPDGSWLIFQSRQHGVDRLRAYNVARGEVVDLSPEAPPYVNERHPTILRASSSELAILFGSGFDGDTRSFERLKVRYWPSMKTEDLLSDPEIGGSIPAILGDRIVFAGLRRAERSWVPDLMSFKIGEGAPVRLTETPHEEWRPSLAPDGTVYFIANPKGNFDIFSLVPGAREPTLVYGTDADEWDPAVSADGRWLAFSSRQTGKWKLVLLDRKSGKASDLTGGPYDDWDPHFHPSHSMIVFARYSGRDTALYGICLYGESPR